MSEERIKKDVVDQLYWDKRVDASSIAVNVSGTRVTLEGEVPTYAVRQAAESDCFTVLGVTGVTNNLRVKHPGTAAPPSDNEIEKRVKTVLRWNSDVNAEDIEVSVRSGVVTLKGAVPSYWKKKKAEDLAGTLFGVTRIVNHIAVAPTQRTVDQAIAQDVAAALDRHTDINPNQINVKVEDGVVSLAGTVTKWGEYHAAEDAARYSSGVVDVKNHLIIASNLE
jgi:osmotically-inducible protein OsmY